MTARNLMTERLWAVIDRPYRKPHVLEPDYP